MYYICCGYRRVVVNKSPAKKEALELAREYAVSHKCMTRVIRKEVK